jgi:hypothetical protein
MGKVAKSRVDANCIMNTGIQAGGIAIGTELANKGLKIKVLFDWKKSGKGSRIPGPFTLLEGGSGVTIESDGRKSDRGNLFQKFEGTRFKDGKTFIEFLLKTYPGEKIGNPVNANTMRIFDGKSCDTLSIQEKGVSGYIPNNADYEYALHQLAPTGKEVAISLIEDQIEKNLVAKKVILEPNWRKSKN